LRYAKKAEISWEILQRCGKTNFGARDETKLLTAAIFFPRRAAKNHVDYLHHVCTHNALELYTI
jgi:hypothetical protein